MSFLRIQYYIIFLIAFAATGCFRKNLLKENEFLLAKVKIMGNKHISTDQLYPFLRQKPNRKFLGLPVYLWAYRATQKPIDKARMEAKLSKEAASYDKKIAHTSDSTKREKLIVKKETRLAKLRKRLEKGPFFTRIIRPLAEPPAIYNEKLIQETTDQFEIFLESKGYFKNYVSYETSFKGKNAKVVYTISEGPSYRLSQIHYNTQEDTLLSKLIIQFSDKSFLKTGEVYDEQNINKERDRLEKLLKNNGYFNFTKQYIEFEVDSTLGATKTDSMHVHLGRTRVGIDVLINHPEDTFHKVYTIDSLYMTVDASSGLASQRRFGRLTSVYDGVVYRYYRDIYSRKVLNYKLFIKPGTQYSLDNTLQTQRQLLSLDAFKFANIVYDTLGGKFVAHIYTSPLNKMVVSDEWGFSVSQGLPGPFVNLTYKIRNIFHRLENFETTFRYGFEGVAGLTSQSNVYRSQEFTGNVSLLIPRIIFPLSKKDKFKLNRYDPKTRLLTGFSYVNRPEYSRSLFRTSLIYSFQLDQKQSFNIVPVDLNVIYTERITDEFKLFLDQLKDQGVRLDQSFRSAFVTSINGYYLYNTNSSNNVGITGTPLLQSSRYLRIFMESGGTVFNLLSRTFVGENPKIFGLDYFSFLKINVDYRYYHPINKVSSWAFRTNIGWAKPYLKEPYVLPYEKYFFIGGSNSIRAWRPRRLGPGSYAQFDADNNVTYQFEQPGEILIENSIEYRFKIIGFFHGALFTDAGNVWAINPSAARPGADFSFDRFYKEIAVGSGVGLRLDFSFLLLRLDAAFKVVDPAQPDGKRWVLNRLTTNNPFKTKDLVIINLGIGYPF